MIYAKFLLAVLGKIIMFLGLPLALLIIPLIYRAQEDGKPLYTWGGQYGTFDRPPQGDNGYVTKHAPFPNVITGWKGWINRIGWMWRNPLYGYSKSAGIEYKDTDVITIKGDPTINDKYRRAGWMWLTLRDKDGKLRGWEWYSITQWSKNRNLRIRLGWKLKTNKVQERGWARHVVTINPFDQFGTKKTN